MDKLKALLSTNTHPQPKPSVIKRFWNSIKGKQEDQLLSLVIEKGKCVQDEILKFCKELNRSSAAFYASTFPSMILQNQSVRLDQIQMVRKMLVNGAIIPSCFLGKFVSHPGIKTDDFLWFLMMGVIYCENLLCFFIRCNDIFKVRYLLETYSHQFCCDRALCTNAIATAAEFSTIEMVEILLNANFPLSSKALNAAYRNDKWERMVDFLWNRNCPVDRYSIYAAMVRGDRMTTHIAKKLGGWTAELLAGALEINSEETIALYLQSSNMPKDVSAARYIIDYDRKDVFRRFYGLLEHNAQCDIIGACLCELYEHGWKDIIEEFLKTHSIRLPEKSQFTILLIINEDWSMIRKYRNCTFISRSWETFEYLCDMDVNLVLGFLNALNLETKIHINTGRFMQLAEHYRKVGRLSIWRTISKHFETTIWRPN